MVFSSEGGRSVLYFFDFSGYSFFVSAVTHWSRGLSYVVVYPYFRS